MHAPLIALQPQQVRHRPRHTPRVSVITLRQCQCFECQYAFRLLLEGAGRPGGDFRGRQPAAVVGPELVGQKDLGGIKRE